MGKRAHIPARVELAAALLQIPAITEDEALDMAVEILGHTGANVPRWRLKEVVQAARFGGIPHDHAKEMTAHQIRSLFARDHYPIRKEDGGPDEPWNITWRFRRAHIDKTAKVDAPDAAKSRDIRKAQAKHLGAMARKTVYPTPEAGFVIDGGVLRPFDSGRDQLPPGWDPPTSRSRRRGGGFAKHPTKVRGVDGKVRKRKRRRR